MNEWAWKAGWTACLR